MTGQPTITDIHTWDGTQTLPDWIHQDGAGLVLPGRDDDTRPQPGWMLVRWSDGHITAASPQVAARAYGPDGMRGRLERAEAELQQHAGAESADAAAGSYAGRVQELEATLAQVRAVEPLTEADRGRDDGPREWADYMRGWNNAHGEMLAALGSEEYAIAQPEPWLHIEFTSPDPTTANTSALNLRDHLAAEFPGVGMRITTNAVEAGPQPDFTTPLAGRVEVRQPCPYCGDRQMIPTRQYVEHVARLHPDVRDGGPGTPVPDAEPDPFGYAERERTGRNAGLTWDGPAVPRFTARPVTPEMERAATERARQAAADSERSAAWFAANGGVIGAPAATEATDIETTARVFAALHHSAEETVTRVIDLHERWVKAGPPPLGTPTARWWDRRLVELRGAIRTTVEESPRTTPDNLPTSNDPHIYLSTGCYHDDHAYCQAMTGLNGAKRPGSCKHCGAKCQCPCHAVITPKVQGSDSGGPDA